MTHKASSVDILCALLSHPVPMTRQGISTELGLASQSIDRALTRLLERGLVESAGKRRNPGTGREAELWQVGPLVRVWTARQQLGRDE